MLTRNRDLRPVRLAGFQTRSLKQPAQGSHQRSETPLGAQTGSLGSRQEIRTGNLDLD